MVWMIVGWMMFLLVRLEKWGVFFGIGMVRGGVEVLVVGLFLIWGCWWGGFCWFDFWLRWWEFLIVFFMVVVKGWLRWYWGCLVICDVNKSWE